MKTFKALAIFSAIAATTLALNVQAADTSSAGAAKSLPKADADKLIAIAQANMAEVAAGKLAAEKSTRADVKDFAQTMVTDHGKALDEVKALATSKSVTLPSEPDAAHKKLAAHLGSLSGAQFDQEYIAKAGVADHTAVHAALTKDIATAKDADVKALAEKMLPTVAHHLEMSKKMQAAK
ncbi:MAG: DUF4142 domain-containing protein [Massilia sp.]